MGSMGDRVRTGSPPPRRFAAYHLPALLLFAAGLAAAAGVRADEAAPLFRSDTAITVTLEAPWDQVLRKSSPSQPHAAVLAYIEADGRARRLDATVQTRGLSRLRVCGFPPLRIRFAPGVTKDSIFEGHRALKLVTHCQAGREYEQYYVKEFLAYRIYNLLTGDSFRVRALDISYDGSGAGRPKGPHFAFVIEDVRDVARRGGHKLADEVVFRPEDFDARAMTRFMLFEYLIGNTDWSVLDARATDACCHNARVLAGIEPPARIPVPYDFDSSGFVDAMYAVPARWLRINSVTHRVYRGFCIHNHALEPVRREFLAQRAAIHALIASESRLRHNEQRKTAAYVDAFYAVLDDDIRFAREITGSCRK